MKNTFEKSLLVSFSLSIVFPGISAFAAVDETSEKLHKAETLINKGKPKSAATLLREVIRSNPNSAEAHLQLGAALAGMVEDNNYDLAIAEEQLALKLDPTSFGARRILGKIYANQHKIPESISTLKEAVQLNPDSFPAHRDLGTVHMSAGNNDEAIASFKKALEVKGTSVESRVKLAVLLARKKDYPAAIEQAREAVKHGGKQAETHLTLANILLESGDSQGAMPSFKEAIAANGYDSLGCLNPLTAAAAFSGLGWAMASPKDASAELLRTAVANQKKAIKAYPTYLTAYIRMADLFARQGKPKEAEATYDGAYRMSRGDAGVAVPYAKHLAYVGKPDEARAMLKKVLEKSPDNKNASEALAEIDKKK